MYREVLITLAVTLAVVMWSATVEARTTLLTIEPTAEQPRNSEGDIIELKDGRLCLIYTRFTGGTTDHAAADLAMRTSADGGRSWSDDTIVVPRERGNNVMSVSLLRLADGRIALFYLRKESLEDCRPVMRLSGDECATFSEAAMCINDEVGYYVLNNDRAVQLAGGRLVLPVALHNKPGQKEPDWAGRVMCYLSDDAGKTWRRSQTTLIALSPNGQRATVQEPGVVQLNDDRLMMFCRTGSGSQYVAYSTDKGDTWSELAPSGLSSPLSPATIERIPWTGELLCVWNDHSGEHAYTGGKRTPLCAAISRDEGKTWLRSRLLESDPEGWYCYTSMTFLDDRVLLAYCAGDSRVGGLNRLKVASLTKDELANLSTAGPPGLGDQALLQPCLDYGRSFINTKADWNSPRFWVESRCRVIDEKAGKTTEFLQCGLCKAERTFATSNLFVADNYDFLPVFSEEHGVIFRRRVHLGGKYREVRPVSEWWGGIESRLRMVRGRVLRSPDEIFAAMQQGKLIVGQTEIRDGKTGRVAVIEYPVKTINFERNRKDWQVDTGPVLLPDLSVPPDQWSHTVKLSHIAFRSPGWADFLVDQPTPVPAADETDKVGDNDDENGDKSRYLTYHYSGQVHHTTRNVLLALDDEDRQQ